MKSAPCPYCSKAVELNAVTCGSCGGLLSVGSFVAIRQALAADPTLSLKDSSSVQRLKDFVKDIDSSLAKAAAEEQEAERIALEEERIALQAKKAEIAAKALEKKRLRDEYLKELKPFKRFLIVRKKHIFFTTVAVVSLSLLVATQGNSYYQEYKIAKLESESLAEAFDKEILEKNFTDCVLIQGVMEASTYPELEAKVQETTKITNSKLAYDSVLTGMLPRTTLRFGYLGNLDALINEGLESLFSMSDRDETAKSTQISKWQAEWKDAVLNECNLLVKNIEIETKLDELDYEIKRILILSDSFREWYPRTSTFEISSPDGTRTSYWKSYFDFAAAWSNRDATPTYFSHTLNVISKYGCPSGLRVDVEWGKIISSETLPSISPGQMVEIKFLSSDVDSNLYKYDTKLPDVINIFCT